MKAVEQIDKAGLVEIRSFPTPPDIVKLVLEAVLVLLGGKTDWDAAKKAMSDLNKFI